MSEFRVNSVTNQNGSAGPQVCGISTFSGKSGVQIPSGSTVFRRQDGGGRGRGVFASGFSGASPSPGNLVDTMDFIEISLSSATIVPILVSTGVILELLSEKRETKAR